MTRHFVLAFLVAALSAMPSMRPAEAAAKLVLYKFTGGSDGGEPYGPLVADSSRNLYGVAKSGGPADVGVVFEISPDDSGSWRETVLHAFAGSDGAYPSGGLLWDSQGDLFGTTFGGGPAGGGVAFELSPAHDGAWTFSQLHAFGSASASGGSEPNGSLVRDRAGNLFGTALLGGSGICSNFPGPCGLVFQLSPATSGAWRETVLYSFAGVPDGEFPQAGVILGTDGRLYGSTSEGGTGRCGDGEGTIIGCGTVFVLQRQDSGWRKTDLYDFKYGEQNMPDAPVVFGRGGALYGTAGYDVFRLRRPAAGTRWKKQTIYKFTEGIAGTIPSGGATFDARGSLYFTTASSGLDGFSTASQLSRPNIHDSTWTQTVLAHFGTGFRFNQPRGGLLVGADGTLYGAVAGQPGYIFAIAR